MGEGDDLHDRGRDVVGPIHDSEMQFIDGAMHQNQIDRYFKSLDERGAAAELVQSQYTGRYPFELLQNANDAIATASGAGTRLSNDVRFVITETALIVANGGAPFGADEIEALCSLSRSSKDARKTIGHKGLGFKSVGEISDTPQIFSRDHMFMFDPARVRATIVARIGKDLPANQRLPTYAFPFRTDLVDAGPDRALIEKCLADKFVTVMRLPFRTPRHREEALRDVPRMLTPRLLILLDQVESLELKLPTGSWSAMCVRPDREVIPFSHVLLAVDDHTQEEWLVFRQRVDLSDVSLVEKLGANWRRVRRVGVAAAVPFNGKPHAAKEALPLHVYFPTDDSIGLRYIIHADFALEPNRRNVGAAEEARAYNDWLGGELIAFLARTVIPTLAKLVGSAGLVDILLPAIASATTTWSKSLRKKYTDALREAAFVPTIGNGLVAPRSARLLPKDCPTNAHEWIDLARFPELVESSVDAEPELRRELLALGAVALQTEDVLAAIALPDRSQAEAFYAWFLEWSSREGISFTRAIRDVPCALTTTGDWVRPSSPVFFPRERGDAVELPDQLALRFTNVPQDARALLGAAGVKPFEWREVLRVAVIPQLVDPATSPELRAAADRVLQEYFEREGGHDQTIREQAQRVLVSAVRAGGAAPSLARASDVYFSSSWVGHQRLDILYAPLPTTEFLAELPPNEADRRSARLAYLIWLGVSPTLGVRRTTGSFNAQRGRSDWQRWYEANRSKIKCSRGNEDKQEVHGSALLANFEEIVSAAQPAPLFALATELATSRLALEPMWRAEVRCTHGHHQAAHANEPPRIIETIASSELRTRAWLPALLDDKLIIEVPRNVWRVAPDMRQSVRRVVPVLPLELDAVIDLTLADRLGLVDGARPRAEALLVLLERLGALPPTDDDVVRAARWAMSRLNTALDAEPNALRRAIPLLARRGGASVFAQRPYVCDDEFLREQWASDVDVLDADRALPKLRAFFNLPDLADEVRIESIVALADANAAYELEHEIRPVLPYIAAVALHAAPSKDDEVRSRLRTLRLVACARLELRCILAHQTRTQSAPVHLQEEMEQVGSIRRKVGLLHVDMTARRDSFAIGRQLAGYLDVGGQGDAFEMLLRLDENDRARHLRVRGISLERVEEERRHIFTDPLDEELREVAFAAVQSNAGAPSPAPSNEDASPPATPSDANGTKPIQRPPPAAPPAPAKPRVLPAVDHDAVTVHDGGSNTVPRPPPGPPRLNNGSTGARNWIEEQQVKHLVGRRGEEVVLEQERRSVKARGFDPARVIWRSNVVETSPYDIESVDEKGEAVYIEVKSTTGGDEASEFEMSIQELTFGFEHAGRYRIYRVLRTHEAGPAVVRYDDPIALLKAEPKALGVSIVKVRLPKRT